jgi:hypothetical protein
VASKIQDGDLLLSFIKGVCCWSGVWRVKTSTAKGHVKPLNPVESTDPWYVYFGMALDVEQVVILTRPEQCFYTRNAALGLKYQGQGIYNEMQKQGDCERIVEAIMKAEKVSCEDAKSDSQEGHEMEQFKAKWQATLEQDPFLADIVRMISGGKCQVCGTTASDWVAKLQGHRNYRNVFDDPRFDYSFLEVHHILPLYKGGDARVEQLLAICPNCHKVIGRNLDAEEKDSKVAVRQTTDKIPGSI